MPQVLRQLVGIVVVAVILTSCTNTPAPEAAPSVGPVAATETVDPGPSARALVGVVVAPQVGIDVVLEDLRDLAAIRDEVDWEIATARSSDVIADLAGRFVDQGASLVCVIGVGRERLVTELALTVPDERFCVGPTTVPAEPAPNVLYVDARVEESAYLAGTLAALVSGVEPTAVITGRQAYAATRQLAAFEFGLVETGGAPTAAVTGPVSDADAAIAAANAQFDTGVGVVLADAATLNPVVLDVARDVARARAVAPPGAAPLAMVGVITGPEIKREDGPLDEEVLAIVRLLPARVVIPAVDRLVTTWEAGAASVGLTEGAVTFELSASTRSAAHVSAMNQFRGEIAAGDRSPLPVG